MFSFYLPFCVLDILESGLDSDSSSYWKSLFETLAKAKCIFPPFPYKLKYRLGFYIFTVLLFQNEVAMGALRVVQNEIL